MNDTSSTMQDIYHKMLMNLSNEERFLLGFSMFESAKKMVLASCPDNYTELEKKIHLFDRFYGNDFSDKEKQIIIDYLVANFEKNWTND